ncbi:uncharacterized protein LOC132723872, partial [Ruditapes philippinarum]|uniref:uncharacterized protein LOC132723872 n=1 Tax=Ruditapes philippinarum TaxID=129788 RepID=UPI00295AAD08
SSEFAIAAAYDSTSVTITFRISSGVVTFLGRNYSNGQKTTITLHKLDVAHIQHVHDLTGTYVDSDKPISIVSGNKCADVPKSVTACDVLLEFVPPLSTWGTKYITAAFKTRLHNRIRVISGSDGNIVKLGNLKVITLNRGQFYEQTFTQDDAVLIDCSNPCLLVQYAEGSTADGQTGDPSMTIVPSLDHFDNDFYFKTPDVVNNYLSIVIHSSDVTGLRLDGRSLSGEEKTVLVTHHKQSERYSEVRVHISQSSHHLYHISDVSFGAILYGFANYESYAYPLGISFIELSAVRLLNGSSSKSGQLEVSRGGIWTPVCSSSVNLDAARVICRTLGYDKYNLPHDAVQSVTLPPGGNYVHGNISCLGTESSITECSVKHIYTLSCTNVAAIDCAPSLKELVHSRCTSTTWDIAVDMDKLTYRFPGSLSDDIYLGDNSCTGVMQGSQLIFRHGLHGCLSTSTETRDEIIFTNQLLYAFHDPTYHFIIRNYNWTLDLNCQISRDQYGHSQVTYNQSIDSSQTLNFTNQYKIDTQFFLDPNFKQAISGNPLQVPVGTNVYVKSYVQDVAWTVKMRLSSCYTTTTTTNQNGMHYFLIKNGCEVDANTHLLSQTDHETKFVFQLFEMTGIHGDIYIKCDAVFCDTSDITSSQQCDTSCRIG